MEEEIQGYDGEKLFPSIKCPVLILQSEAISDEDARRASAQLQDVAVVKFENISHFLQMDGRGYPVLIEVVRFLESLNDW